MSSDGDPRVLKSAPEERADTEIENPGDDRADTEIDSAPREEVTLDEAIESARPAQAEAPLEAQEAAPDTEPHRPADSEVAAEESEETASPVPVSASEPASAPKRTKPQPQEETFHVAGFFRRFGGFAIDLAVILPISLILAWLAGLISGIHLPPSRHHGLDFWLDLMLANDPAFVGGLGLILTVMAIYLFVFQGTTGRTLGMRATKTRIIDVYGDSPSMAQAGGRTAGYLLSIATLGLGFLWVAFDAEKRGLHDWVSGTYVIKLQHKAPAKGSKNA